MTTEKETKVYTTISGGRVEERTGNIPFIKVLKKPIPVNACMMALPFEVDTMEGTMTGKAGDYLMKGINGELYPCDSDIFHKSYDMLEIPQDEKQEPENPPLYPGSLYTDDHYEIHFQSGPVKEYGVNGCQTDDIIEILLDRMTILNSGDFRCRENSMTITKLDEALMWQKKRTTDRVKRGVEGKDEV